MDAKPTVNRREAVAGLTLLSALLMLLIGAMVFRAQSGEDAFPVERHSEQLAEPIVPPVDRMNLVRQEERFSPRQSANRRRIVPSESRQ